MSYDLINLGSREITAALTGEVITEGVSAAGVAQECVDGLGGITAATIQCAFVYGSGGTTCVVVVRTSLDQGASWIDIARFDFATTTAKKVANVSGLYSKAVAAVAALGAEGVTDGVLGDRFRVDVTSTGTYAGSTSVAVRMQPR
jgi:hypothetical protein